MKIKIVNTSISLCVIAAFFVVMLLPLAVFSDEEESSQQDTPEWIERINFGVEAGTDQKLRAYFETVQPLHQDFDKEHTVFIQPRFSYYDDDAAYNLGLGYRRLLNDNSILLGTNVFFDYENDDQHYRTGVGFEAFWNLIECRLNTYIGLSPRRLVNQTGSQRSYEKAVDGLDYEFGLPLPYMNWVKLFGGGFWYDYEKFSDKQGWRIRTELKPFTFSTINFITYDDNKGEQEYRVDARITLPFGAGGSEESRKFCNIGFSKEAYPEKVDHSDRTLDRVERQHAIEVERYTETASGTIEIRRGD
ncbi:inverse autotransporter beta domain-containing protein [Candidatus Omnitrophota bacterium]